MSAGILSKGKSRGKPMEVETLLEESDDDDDAVLGPPNKHLVDSRTKFNKSNSQDDSLEIVLDDSDSDIEIEEIEPDAPSVPFGTTKNKSTLDENKVKSILNKVASKNSPNVNSASKLPSGLAVTRAPNLATKPKLASASMSLPKKSEPSTPRLVLKKVGSKWLNSSTPQDFKPKSVDDNPDSNTSNSDEDFVPVKDSSRSKANDSDTDEDSSEASPKLNRSTRSTRSSMNTTRSDLSEDVTLDTTLEIDDEIQEELRKLEALQQILAKHNPNDLRRADTVPQRKKSKLNKKLKQSKTPKVAKAIETPKPKPPAPRVIDRGPIDCFDDLIVETTAGFPCNYCDSKEMFQKRREMIYHMQTKHEEELNEEQKNGDLSGLFPCKICNIAFCSKFILRTHKKAHMKSQGKGCDKYYQYYLRFGQPALV